MEAWKNPPKRGGLLLFGKYRKRAKMYRIFQRKKEFLLPFSKSFPRENIPEGGFGGGVWKFFLHKLL